MSDLIEKLDKKEDEMLDLYMEMLGTMSTSMMRKIKKKDPVLFAQVMVGMSDLYVYEEMIKEQGQ